MPDSSPGEKLEKTNGGQGTNPWQRLKRWLQARQMTLMTLPDTPHAIALGSAIGMFFGFTPLFGLKTLLSFGGAWLCKGNKTAAVITVTLHDVLLPFMPAIFYWQYTVGMWAMSGRVPPGPGFRHLALHDYVAWTTFLTVGRPILIGSLYLAAPAAVVFYFGLRGVLQRARKRHMPETPKARGYGPTS